MTRWQYKKVNLADVPCNRLEVDLLDEVGKDGWELVAITANNVAYLRRQIASSVDAPEVVLTVLSRRRKTVPKPSDTRA
jgi:hypothetical protein